MKSIVNIPFHRRSSTFQTFRPILVVIFIIISSCAGYQKSDQENIDALYRPQELKNGVVGRHAPLFLIEGYQSPHNRIGQPSARYDSQGNEEIYVDPDKLAIYTLVRNFWTENGMYTNLIYRVHFSKVPFSLIPFYLTAGKNVGIFVIITLDAEERPLLITTLGTCGCYMSIVPTSWLPRDALPTGWGDGPLDVFGETLPSRLDMKGFEKPGLLVRIRPDTHRIMGLEIIERADASVFGDITPKATPLLHIDELDRLPINAGLTSFYYKEGPYRGLVKDAFKSWETLFMGLISLDPLVGTDKLYGAKENIRTPFYTSLKPWNRNSSDMWNFSGFLEFWGWDL